MTDWTSPRTWSVSELVTAALMNTHVRDNLLHLKEQAEAALKLLNRKGGSASDWTVAGTTDYIPANVKTEAGVISVNATTGSGSIFTGSASLVFPAAFSNKPIVICSLLTGLYDPIRCSASAISTTGATIQLTSFASITGVSIAWLAIGPS